MVGSKSIIGVEDTKLYPIRGQAILVESSEINEFLAAEGGAYVCKWKQAGMFSGSIIDDHSTQGGEATYIIPRPGEKYTNTVLLGGTYQSGNWDTSLHMDVAQRIFERCAKLAPSLKDSGVTKILRHQVGLRPAREGGARVETEIVALPLRSTHNLVPLATAGVEGGNMQVVHAYGFGWVHFVATSISPLTDIVCSPGGYQASWGVAADVLSLIKNTTT